MSGFRRLLALCHALTAPGVWRYQTRDNVLLWSEKQVNNRIGECTDPFKVEGKDYQIKFVFN